jgi:hypothetical protein
MTHSTLALSKWLMDMIGLKFRFFMTAVTEPGHLLFQPDAVSQRRMGPFIDVRMTLITPYFNGRMNVFPGFLDVGVALQAGVLLLRRGGLGG